MGRILDFDEQNKSADDATFPKLKLKHNEKARIVCLEKPYSEYVHNLRAPKIVNGVAAVETRKRKDGTEYQDYVYEWMGNPLCSGDEGTLADKGADPKNCPICAGAARGDSVKEPDRRFAMHILRYATKNPLTTDIATPFSVQTLVWAFGDKVFSKIIDIAKEVGNLQQHDLLLGPCSSEDFQQFEIMFSTKAEFLADETVKKTAIDTFKLNRASDLGRMCGQKWDKARMEDALNKIAQRYAIANRVEAPVESSPLQGNTATLADGLDDLLKGSTPASKPVDANEGPDLMSVLEPGTQSVDQEIDIQVAKPGSSGEVLTPEDLFADLLAN